MSEIKLSRLCVSAFVAAVILVGGLPFLAAPSRADSSWTLRDDATGGDCTLIGTWDGATKTCTLTTDVLVRDEVGIVIAGNGITLDGGGHSITGFYGVFADRRTGVAIKNAIVGGYVGIVLVSSSLSTVSGNTVSGNIGIRLVYNSGSNLVSGNTVSGGIAIDLRDSAGNTVSTNAVTVGADSIGIHVHNSPGSVVDANTVSGGYFGILLWDSGLSTVSGNTVTLGVYRTVSAIHISGSPGSVVDANTVTQTSPGVGYYGIYLTSSGVTVSENTVTGSSRDCILVDDLSSGNMITANIVSGCGSSGIYLVSTNANTVSGNTISSTPGGISLYDSDGNTVSGNLVLSAIILWYSDGNTVSGNLVLSPVSIHLVYSDGNTIFHNTFISSYFPPNVDSTNTWNNQAGEGNYWSDYLGQDNGAGGRIADDGIGDTDIPHLGRDYYPLVPIVVITGPAPDSIFPVDAPVAFTGHFASAPGIPGYSHTAEWELSSGSSTIALTGTVDEAAGTVADTYTFTSAGVYYLKLSVTDEVGRVGRETMIGDLPAMVVVYDPSEGYVTGAGWILSPPGAYIPDPSATGRASFGFVSRYRPGKSEPSGSTDFRFVAGGLRFASTSYDWLVCGGPKCQFKGSGTINGGGNYGFLLSAIDGELPGGGGQDKLRIKIWDKDTGEVLYDNGMGADDSADPTTVIGGGSIVIHKG